MKIDKPKKLAFLGMLCALAMALSFLESLIPPIIPIPGVKPGFSNIVTMLSLSAFGAPYALAITLFKSLFTLITRGVTAFFMSISGGLLSLVCMIILFKFCRNHIGYIGIGVLCAVAHNIGQLSVASVILGETILNITPLLLLSGVICGIITGTVFHFTVPVLYKLTKTFSQTRESKGSINKC